MSVRNAFLTFTFFALAQSSSTFSPHPRCSRQRAPPRHLTDSTFHLTHSHTPRDLCSALPTTPSSRLRPQTRTQTTPTILARPRALDTCTSPSTTWTTKCHAVTRSIPKAGLEDARLPLNIRRLDDRPTTTTHTRSNLTDNNDNSTHNHSHQPRPSLWQ